MATIIVGLVVEKFMSYHKTPFVVNGKPLYAQLINGVYVAYVKVPFHLGKCGFYDESNWYWRGTDIERHFGPGAIYGKVVDINEGDWYGYVTKFPD